MKFDDYRIAPELKRNLVDLGFKRPTDIQFKSIPHILNGEDVLAIAQTGTGKTAAFAIPIIHMIHVAKINRRSAGIRCVVMEPTRELALQVTAVFESLARHTKVKPFCVFGGVDQDPQIAALERGIDILVATPGRLFDLASQGHLHLDQVDLLVLDEADHMLALGFLKDIQDLTRRLPRQRQTMFFSATIDENIKKLAYSLVRNPIRIQISPKDPVSKNIDHSVAFVEMDDKRFFLARMAEEQPEHKILVFVRTKVRAERVAKALERANVPSITLHGDKEQAERLEALRQFREGIVKILIATDVSARGIDIPGVDQVVNYDLPELPETYVHRVGRTGRGDKRGQAVAFCSTEERPLLHAIEDYIGKPVKVLSIGKQVYQETLEFFNDRPDRWKEMMSALEEAERWERKRRKQKK